MVQSDPDERLIYLACQHIFRGTYSQSEVFDSTLKARIRFPELFDVSPTRSAEREVSEAEAARDEANTVKEISDREASKETAVISQTEVKDERTFCDAQLTFAKFSEQAPGTTESVQSLYPIYMHYRCQHLVLTTIQELVEESCFQFAQQNFPQVLAANGWDCPEAVELTEWIKILARQSNPLLKPPLEQFIGLLRELRHSAVHRLRKTAAGVERLAENAQLFLTAWEDSIRSKKIECLRREVRSAIEELQRNKDLLERRLLAQLKEIQKKTQ
ncbi:hypothetical protein N7520_001680 [Penicillium odoratum]|uniref:uncharacterized protein n=1 Tax=Penicillium odoratum TaxID=1167516 RepID=UPI002548C8D4|nr:uncharacterized protein N7520_001680 [Penicillium odoratum]KAJ5778434.1 hypothetical protein N7520_001680 [Penicillium odoratum]